MPKLEQKSFFVDAGPVHLPGNLTIPRGASGIVLFAHGSGSSRHSPRNQFVAQVLQEAGLATLLFDLLTEEEDLVYERRFDIPLLADRVAAATDSLSSEVDCKDLAVGYFGASTGAAAALVAAADLGTKVRAIVSRGGRPDLAGAALPRVVSPTLLLVGGNDFTVIQLNQEASELLNCVKELTIVPGASHLFEEPGTLEEVSRCAADWFTRHLEREFPDD